MLSFFHGRAGLSFGILSRSCRHLAASSSAATAPWKLTDYVRLTYRKDAHTIELVTLPAFSSYNYYQYLVDDITDRVISRSLDVVVLEGICDTRAERREDTYALVAASHSPAAVQKARQNLKSNTAIQSRAQQFEYFTDLGIDAYVASSVGLCRPEEGFHVPLMLSVPESIVLGDVTSEDLKCFEESELLDVVSTVRPLFLLREMLLLFRQPIPFPTHLHTGGTMDWPELLSRLPSTVADGLLGPDGSGLEGILQGEPSADVSGRGGVVPRCVNRVFEKIENAGCAPEDVGLAGLFALAPPLCGALGDLLCIGGWVPTVEHLPAGSEVTPEMRRIAHAAWSASFVKLCKAQGELIDGRFKEASPKKAQRTSPTTASPSADPTVIPDADDEDWFKEAIHSVPPSAPTRTASQAEQSADVLSADDFFSSAPTPGESAAPSNDSYDPSQPSAMQVPQPDVKLSPEIREKLSAGPPPPKRVLSPFYLSAAAAIRRGALGHPLQLPKQGDVQDDQWDVSGAPLEEEDFDDVVLEPLPEGFGGSPSAASEVFPLDAQEKNEPPVDRFL